MKLEDIINQDIKKAMIEKSVDRLEAIRTIKSAIQVERAKEGVDLSDEQVIKIVQKLVSQRTESGIQYAEAGRIDLVDHELFLVTVFKTYLPEQLTDEVITEKVKEFIASVGASSVKDMGKVMAIANKEFVGKADMKLVGTIVKNLLN